MTKKRFALLAAFLLCGFVCSVFVFGQETPGNPPEDSQNPPSQPDDTGNPPSGKQAQAPATGGGTGKPTNSGQNKNNATAGSGIQKQLAEMKKQLNELQKTTALNGTSISGAEQQLKDMREKLNPIGTSISETQKQLSDLQQKINSNNESISEVENRLRELQQKTGQRDTSISELQTQLTGMQKEIGTANTSISEMENQLKDIQEKLNPIGMSISEMENQLKKLQQKIDSNNASISEMQNQLKGTSISEQQLKNMRDEIVPVGTSISETKNQLNVLQNTIVSNNTSISDSEGQLKNMQKEIDPISMSISVAENQLRELQRKIDLYAIPEMQKQLKDLKDILWIVAAGFFLILLANLLLTLLLNRKRKSAFDTEITRLRDELQEDIRTCKRELNASKQHLVSISSHQPAQTDFQALERIEKLEQFAKGIPSRPMQASNTTTPLSSQERQESPTPRQAPINSDDTLAVFNNWAANPTNSRLPDQFYYVKGEPRIRTHQSLSEADRPTRWIVNHGKGKKYLFPNPNSFDDRTDIKDLYRMDMRALKAKGQNKINVIKACEMSERGYIQYAGELQLL